MSPDDVRPIASPSSALASGRIDWKVVLVAVALFAVLIPLAGPRPVDHAAVDAYHSRVRATRSAVPHVIGDWVGRDIAVPQSAIEILHPNVLLNRRYENTRTGETASVLFVQCSDARDLQGHYPPNCYPAHGMIPGTEVAREWHVGAQSIPGVRYRFRRGTAGAETHMVIDNFMVLPTGAFGRDMNDVVQVAKDRKLRHFGAAQVQILTDESMSDERRDDVLREFVRGLRPLLHSLDSEASRG